MSRKDKAISDNTIVKRDPEQEFSMIDNEVVMLSLKKAEYYALNSVASRIWHILETPVPVAEIIRMLTKEYKIDPETCRKETLEYLKELSEKELISFQ